MSSLKPEKGRSAELGLLWQAPGTRAGVTVYRNKVRNLIGYDPDTREPRVLQAILAALPIPTGPR